MVGGHADTPPAWRPRPSCLCPQPAASAALQAALSASAGPAGWNCPALPPAVPKLLHCHFPLPPCSPWPLTRLPVTFVAAGPQPAQPPLSPPQGLPRAHPGQERLWDPSSPTLPSLWGPLGCPTVPPPRRVSCDRGASSARQPPECLTLGEGSPGFATRWLCDCGLEPGPSCLSLPGHRGVTWAVSREDAQRVSLSRNRASAAS